MEPIKDDERATRVEAIGRVVEILNRTASGLFARVDCPLLENEWKESRDNIDGLVLLAHIGDLRAVVDLNDLDAVFELAKIRTESAYAPELVTLRNEVNALEQNVVRSCLQILSRLYDEGVSK